jgi:hypothetical protein
MFEICATIEAQLQENSVISKYSFERTELRVLQNFCNGDNEKFLNLLADSIGRQNEKVEELKNQITQLTLELNLLKIQD